jgi:hypothetical protein
MLLFAFMTITFKEIEMTRMIQNAVAVDKVIRLVDQMTKLIEKQSAEKFQITDANYTVGYLQSMLVTACCKNPSVLDNVIETIDYLETA